MPTKTHRIIRKVAPILDRIEPYAIFVAYLAVGIMATFSWVFPPKVSDTVGNYSLWTQSALLSVGAILGLIGHMFDKVLIEFWGLCACVGGIFITLCAVISIMVNEAQYNYGQFAGLILLALGLLFSHGFKLYHDITKAWINLTPAEIARIYKEASNLK